MIRPAVIFCMLGLVLSSAPSRAQSAKDFAKRHFELGRDYYREGRYDDAVTEFQAAYKSKPHPAILFNLGECYEKLGDLPHAIEYYRRYVHENPGAQDLERVSTLADNLEARLKVPLTIESEPADATVLLDGSPVGNTPVTVQALPGTHHVQLSHASYQTLSKDVEVAKPSTTAHVAMSPAAGVTLTAAAEPAAPAGPSGPSIVTRPAFWGGVGGVALVGVGAVLLGVAGSKHQALNAGASSTITTYADAQAAASAERAAQAIGVVGVVAGVAGLGASAYYLFFHHPPTSSVQVAIVPGRGASAVVSMSFP